MERRYLRTLLPGVALVGAALLWLEVLVFRLCAATVGHVAAYPVSLTAGATAALGAVALAPGARAQSPRLERRAATLALLMTATWLAAMLAATWLSHQLAGRRPEITTGLAVALMLPWALPFLFGGAVLGTAARAVALRVGLFGFSEALGGALICLALPAAMWLGVPRAALVGAFLPALAAILFGVAGAVAGEHLSSRRRPSWTVLVTGPLIVATLLAGDIGAPWLQFRAVRAAPSRDARQAWSLQGLLTVYRARRFWRLYVDGHDSAVLAEQLRSRLRAGTSSLDVAYALPTPDEWSGLVVASGSGREAQVALDNGAKAVVALERSPEAVNQLLRSESTDISSEIVTPSQGVELRLGDGRAVVQSLSGPFHRIFVVGAEPFVQIAPRLLPWSDRLYSQGAMADYLQRLSPDGLMLISVPERRVQAVAATLRAAAGAKAGAPMGRRMLACSASRGEGLVLVGGKPFDRKQRRNLTRSCKKNRLTVWKNEDLDGRRPAAGSDPSGQASASIPAAITDDQPFLEATPPAGQLLTVTRQAAAAYLSNDRVPAGPGPVLPKASPRRASRRAAGEEPDGAARRANQAALLRSQQVASVVLGLVAVASIFVLTFGVALVRGLLTARRSAAPRRLAALICTAAVGYGVALALAQLVLAELSILVLGHTSLGWLVGIPLVLAGMAGGRLLSEAVAQARLRRFVAGITVGIVPVLVGGYALAGIPQELWRLDAVLRWTVLCVTFVGTGMVLGAPLAATLRLVGAAQPSAVSLGWGSHAAGWALGGAAGQLIARYAGMRHLLLAAAVVAVVATGLVLLSRPRRRRAPPAAAR